MLKCKTYYKYQFISLNKYKKIQIYSLILLLWIFSIYLNIHIFSKCTNNIELAKLKLGLNSLLILSTMFISCSYLLKFIDSKEFIFLKSFGISKIDSYFIFIIKTFWINLILSNLYFNTIINLYQISILNIFHSIVNSVLIILVASLIEILICFFIKKIYLKELRLLFFIFFTLFSIKYLIIYPFKIYGLDNIVETVLINLGTFRFVQYIFNILFNGNIFGTINILITLILLSIILFYFVNFNSSQDCKYIFKRKHTIINPKIHEKSYPPFLGFLIKDIILIKNKISFLVIQFGFICLGIFLITNAFNKNNIGSFILCAIFAYINSFISLDIFQFDERNVWILKSLPLENKTFFIYKFMISFIVSIITPIILFFIALIFNKISFIYFIKYLILLLIFTLLICLVLSSILYIFFPDVKKSTVLITVLSILIIIFPPISIVVIVVCLKSVKNKLYDIEV